MEEKERLQKVIAHAGVASRRSVEQMICDGRVKVNGQLVCELGLKVGKNDVIEVDGKRLQAADRRVYLLLYKPIGVVTTVSDPHGRKTVVDLLEGVTERVYPVGRLDYDTSGLLLLTNDGELANQLMHPRFGVEKTYEAVVAGAISDSDLTLLCAGIVLDGRRTSPAAARLLGTDGRTSRVEITIHEGRNRQVRRMFDAIGHACMKLTRVRYGPLTIDSLRPGKWRMLTEKELKALHKSVQQNG